MKEEKTNIPYGAILWIILTIIIYLVFGFEFALVLFIADIAYSLSKLK